METQVEQLDGDRVRLTVEVPADDIHHAVEHATHDLAERVRVPGFRPGKVPMPVLIQRIGKKRLYTEAVDSHIGSWFWSAAARERVRPIEQPAYSYELPSGDEESWRFTAEFGVQPHPEPADWTTLEVPKREIEVDPELVSKELEKLQATVAELSLVESRTAQLGDVVVVDLMSTEYVTRDYVFELGDDRLVDEIEAAVRGLLPGETREVRIGEGPNAIARVQLKEIHEKVLPPLDDAFARAASEFETLEELRADVERRIREQLEEEEEGRFRQAAVDALVKATGVEPAPLVVDMRTQELLTGFVRNLEARGIDVNAYLRAAGIGGRELQQRLRAEAEQSIARELVLEAVAEKLGIEVTDDDIRRQLREQGESEEDIAEFIERGGADRVRQDLRLKEAVDRIAAEVKPISPELAEARESLWTPEKGEAGKERPAAEKKLWTPGT